MGSLETLTAIVFTHDQCLNGTVIDLIIPIKGKIMKKGIKISIGIFLLLAFSIASFITVFWQFFFLLYIIGIVVIIWVIIKLLRYPTSSNRTFDKYFYDDLNIKILEEKKLNKGRN